VSSAGRPRPPLLTPDGRPGHRGAERPDPRKAVRVKLAPGKLDRGICTVA